MGESIQAAVRGAEAAYESAAGNVASVINASILLAREAYQSGQWDEARRLAAGTTTLCDTRGHQLQRRASRLVTAALLADCGDVVMARELADEAICWAAPRGAWRLESAARHVLVRAALAELDFTTAYDHAIMISPAGQLARHEPYASGAMLDLVEAALRSGHPRQAAAHVAAIREAGVAAVSSRLALLAATAEALVASDADADQAYGEALALRDARRWPFDLARTHLLCGERLRRARRGRAAGGGGAPATTHLTTEARTHLVAAHDAFQRLGARAWADRAAMELRATGQVRQHGPAGAAEKWALTPQELEIALLAATGLTNKQIGSRLYLSHRTVGAHLYRVFPKLGITSRAALRDALSRHATAHVVG